MGSIVVSPASIMTAPNGAKFGFVRSFNVTGPALADVLVQLPFPSRYIRIVSCLNAALANTLFFHFAPLRRSYSGTGTGPYSGNENWIPMCNWVSALQNTKLGFTIKLCFPITQFYLDVGFEAGGVDHNLTFLCSNDVDFISDQWQ
jgi:hypothetical protein